MIMIPRGPEARAAGQISYRNALAMEESDNNISSKVNEIKVIWTLGKVCIFSSVSIS